MKTKKKGQKLWSMEPRRRGKWKGVKKTRYNKTRQGKAKLWAIPITISPARLFESSAKKSGGKNHGGSNNNKIRVFVLLRGGGQIAHC